jgi:hypothetical protein
MRITDLRTAGCLSRIPKAAAGKSREDLVSFARLTGIGVALVPT